MALVRTSLAESPAGAINASWYSIEIVSSRSDDTVGSEARSMASVLPPHPWRSDPDQGQARSGAQPPRRSGGRRRRAGRGRRPSLSRTGGTRGGTSRAAPARRTARPRPSGSFSVRAPRGAATDACPRLPQRNQGDAGTDNGRRGWVRPPTRGRRHGWRRARGSGPDGRTRPLPDGTADPELPRCRARGNGRCQPFRGVDSRRCSHRAGASGPGAVDARVDGSGGAGEPAGIRTLNLVIKSHLLYR